MKFINPTAAVFFSFLIAGNAMAATGASNADAEIVAAIAISNTVGLQFGQIAPSIAIGTVSVSTTGIREASGGVTLGNNTAATAASFTVSGAANNIYSITLPASTTLTAAAGAPMVVDTFVSNPTVLSGGTLSAGGTQVLLVGATLHVGVSQVPNPYTGTFNVTVAYP